MSEESNSETVQPVVYCDFCGNSSGSKEVDVIIRANNVGPCVCDKCVEICRDIIERHRLERDKDVSEPIEREAG